MDGRIQAHIRDWAQRQFGTDYVDMVTVPGPDQVLARDAERRLGLARDVALSRDAHGSRQVVVASHSDCAGSAVTDKEHQQMVRDGVRWLADQLPNMTVVDIHVDVDPPNVRVVARCPAATTAPQ